MSEPTDRLTPAGRAGLKAMLGADRLERVPGGYRAPGWNAAVDLPDEWVERVPLPMLEPPNGSILYGRMQSHPVAGFVWHRDDKEGHAEPWGDPAHWWSHDRREWVSWGDIQAEARGHLALSVLVPAPEANDRNAAEEGP